MGSKAPEDKRFSSIQSDPRFKLPKKKSIRGELDPRFKEVLSKDERFKTKAHTDKYGRKIKAKDAKKELSRYYNFNEDEEGSESKSDSDSFEDFEEPSDDSDTSIEDAKKYKKKPSMRELMRGEGVDSSSESDESSSESDDSDEDEDLKAQRDEYEQVRVSKEAIPQGEESKRLAVVNLDWDNVNSTDIMATFSSFVPPNRSILSVQIYPSEYGKQQMQLEELNGPNQHLFDQSEEKAPTKKPVEDISQEGEEDYSSSKLRRYQLQRLQYYYAVVECDSIEAASAIYSSCDGAEYESSANFFDLRFIPDEVDFSQDKCRDECFKVPASYKPNSFTTDALQHSKVKLTWDETPKERARITQKAFSQKDVENDDLKAYLASESDSEEDEETIAKRYRALIGGDAEGVNEEGSEGEAVEITFNPVLEGKDATLEIVGEGDKSQKDPETNPEDNLSTIEKYRLKEKQRKLRRMENYKARKAAEQEEKEQDSASNKAELELLAMDDELLTAKVATESKQETEGKKKGKKLTKRAAKKKAEMEAENDFDTSDPRFTALYDDPDFAIDSTLPQYKKTKGMEKIISERRKRRHGFDGNDKQISKPKRRLDTTTESTQSLVSKLRRKHNN